MILLYLFISILVITPLYVFLAKATGIKDITIGVLLAMIILSLIPIMNVMALVAMIFNFCDYKYGLSKFFGKKIL